MQKSQPNISGLKLNNGEWSISSYAGTLEPKTVASEAAKLKKAFPALSGDFFGILYERLEANGFCDKRLIDAINHVIDNCPYPTPTIAQILSFDQRTKLYTYDQMLDYVHQHGVTTEKFELVKIGDRKLWRLK